MATTGWNDHSEFSHTIEETVFGVTKLQIQGPVRVKQITLQTTAPTAKHTIKNYAETETLFDMRPGRVDPYMLWGFYAKDGISISSATAAYVTVYYENMEH
jgi:hypothetical protein